MMRSAASSSPAAQRPSRPRAQSGGASARQREREAGRKPRGRWAVAAIAVLAVTASAVLLATLNSRRGAEQSTSTVTEPFVGGDLHTLTAVGSALYVGGHAAAAVSHDGGRHWARIPSLDGADSMGWAVTPDAILVGGHPGLFRSSDGGTTFARLGGGSAVRDVHALGGTGTTLYLSSPQSGLLASVDGGRSWQVRSRDTGRSFMGTILVSPDNPSKLLLPTCPQDSA